MTNHANRIVGSVNSKYKTFYPIAKPNKLTIKTAGIIYETYIRSIITYSIPVLFLLTQKKKLKIFSLQTKFLRFLAKFQKYQTNTYLLKVTNSQPSQDFILQLNEKIYQNILSHDNPSVREILEAQTTCARRSILTLNDHFKGM